MVGVSVGTTYSGSLVLLRALAAFKGPCVEACEDMFFQIAQLLAPQHLATLLWQQEHLDIMILS